MVSFNILDELTHRTELIKAEAKALGFSDCGISSPAPFEQDGNFLLDWISKGMNGEMDYLEKNIEKRIDPLLIYPEAKSVLSVILNYNTNIRQKSFPHYKVSKYAFYEDYHIAIKTKLKKLLNFVKTNIEGADGRFFVDSGPLFERAFAKRAGLGWTGKNALLVTKKAGSFVYIGELFLNIELNYDKPMKDHCGECDKCIQACPTQAIIQPRVMQATKCISYQTIVSKSDIPVSFISKFDNWIYGCDSCQDVCPWNKVSDQLKPGLELNHDLLNLDQNDWKNFSPEMFEKISANSQLKEKTFERIRRNIDFIDHQGH